MSTPARTLWLRAGLPEPPLARLHFSPDPDPAINSSFRLGTAAQTAIGLSALSAAHFHELRTGQSQDVSVDARHAVIEYKSEGYYLVDGKLPGLRLWEDLAGLYKTKDGYTRIHTNFPHHRQGILDLLQCESSKPSVAAALSKWNSVDFETAASARGLCATALRSFREWDQHPQRKALAAVPPVTIRKIGEAPKRAAQASASSPLEGIRVLDLTRVIAGPVGGRTLAAHGADVLLITSPNLPSLPYLERDMHRGKRTARLDLTQSTDRERLQGLAVDADVFLQGYRPGGLLEKGFGPYDVAALKPGIVYASIAAYGFDGPWKSRRGFDSLTQTATGFNVAEAEALAAFSGVEADASVPKALPEQALDHTAGYFLAFGINAALCKTVTEGGSWEVQVSLASVGQWIWSLGQLAPVEAFGIGRPLPSRTFPPDEEIAKLLVDWSCAWRASEQNPESSQVAEILSAIGHSAVMSETPVKVSKAPMDLEVHEPVWR